MPDIAVRRAKELRAEAKAVLEDLLGRSLREEEEVTVMAGPPGLSSPDASREAALGHLAGIMDRAAERAEPIPQAELDALIDEAMGDVRRWEP